MRPHREHNFTISNGKKSETKAKFKGSYEYWERCVERLSIFIDKKLSPGYITDGHIDLNSRLDIYKHFKSFINCYSDESREDYRPFKSIQEEEMRRVLRGGILIER